jgi:hypothetical protein
MTKAKEVKLINLDKKYYYIDFLLTKMLKTHFILLCLAIPTLGKGEGTPSGNATARFT